MLKETQLLLVKLRVDCGLVCKENPGRILLHVAEAPPSLASRVTGILEDRFIDQWTVDILSFNVRSAS